MSCLQPNFLSPLGFQFILSKTPTTNFFIQSVVIPSVSLGSVDRPTTFGTRLTEKGNIYYDLLSITFKIDEEMKNYLEIFNWMHEHGTPDSHSNYDDTEYDGRLIILDNSKRAIMNILFTDIFPTSISPISLDSTLTDVPYLTSDVTFSFDRMYFDRI